MMSLQALFAVFLAAKGERETWRLEYLLRVKQRKGFVRQCMTAFVCSVSNCCCT